MTLLHLSCVSLGGTGRHLDDPSSPPTVALADDLVHGGAVDQGFGRQQRKRPGSDLCVFSGEMFGEHPLETFSSVPSSQSLCHGALGALYASTKSLHGFTFR